MVDNMAIRRTLVHVLGSPCYEYTREAKIMKPRTYALLGTVLGVLVAATASATVPTLIIDPATRLLHGAEGVVVDGTNYNVNFEVGSCVSVFQGCTSTNEFTFHNSADALSASRALLDTVLIASPQGEFFRHREIFGCSSVPFPSVCGFFTPYGLDLSSSFPVLIAEATIGFRGTSLSPAFLDFDYSCCSGQPNVWAVWSAGVATVPESHEYALLLTGLAIVGYAAGRRRG